MMISYEYRIHFRGQIVALVWQTDDGTGDRETDTDCVLVSNGKIVSGAVGEGVAMVAHRCGLILEQGDDEPLNLDGLEQLLDLPATDAICAQILNGWNLFNDIARSLGVSLNDDGTEASNCYDKLFFGNNLASTTPDGEHYRPSFTRQERSCITTILNRGRAMLAANI
ncbi:hypothetical protein ACX80O_14590 [Arthrobacter sp. Hz1]